MEKLMHIRQFPKLSPILPMDELRDWLNYAHVFQDYIIVTNAHVLVRHHTNEFFDDEIIAQFPKEGIKLDKWSLQELEKAASKDFSYDPDNDLLYITFGRSKKKVRVPTRHPEIQGSDGTINPPMPDIRKTAQNIIDYKPKAHPLIRFNAKLLELVQRGLGATKVELHFADLTQGITVNPLDGDFKETGIGIIMPVES